MSTGGKSGWRHSVDLYFALDPSGERSLVYMATTAWLYTTLIAAFHTPESNSPRAIPLRDDSNLSAAWLFGFRAALWTTKGHQSE